MFGFDTRKQAPTFDGTDGGLFVTPQSFNYNSGRTRDTGVGHLAGPGTEVGKIQRTRIRQ